MSRKKRNKKYVPAAKKADVKRKPLNVVVCVPGNRFTDKFLTCWTNLIQWCQANNINIALSSAYDSNVYYVRNKCLHGSVTRGKYQKPFDGKVDYDYIMWIDSDMYFSVEHFIALLEMNTDIASGIYKMSDMKHYATVLDWDVDFYRQHSTFQFLTDDIIAQHPDIIPVQYTGFGWVLIKKGVLESIEYPWFRPLWWDFGENIVEFTSEDVGICKTLIEAGYEIKVNTKVRLGHEKQLVI